MGMQHLFYSERKGEEGPGEGSAMDPTGETGTGSPK